MIKIDNIAKICLTVGLLIMHYRWYNQQVKYVTVAVKISVSLYLIQGHTTGSHNIYL